MKTKILIFTMIISILFMRPSLLGSYYTNIGLILTFLSFFIYILTFKEKKLLNNKHYYMFIFFIFMWSHFLGNSIMHSIINAEFIIKAFISQVSIFLIFGYLLSNIHINILFFKVFIYLMAILGFSAMISTILLEIDITTNLVLFQIMEYNIIFPFSLEYGVYTIPNVHVFHRFMGFFREAGIAPAFLSWAFVYAKYYKFPKWILIGIIFGVFLTLSTIAIVNFVLVLILFYVIDEKITLIKKIVRSFLGIFSTVVLVYIVNYMPGIGLQAKAETHGASITDRSTSMYTAINNVLDNPLGTGMYSSSNEGHSGINLIAMLDEIGILGFVLAILIFLTPLLFKKVQNNSYYLVSVLPMLITSLLAQPILDAPLVYILIFATFNNKFLNQRKR